jgi:hypothetical protein
MDHNNSAIIYVDFEINRRDLFRVNLDMAKWRLIVGFLVAAIPIAGISYFFIVIDAGDILLELSPLLIVTPLVAIGAQILRLHAVCRKFMATLPDSQRRIQYLFKSDMDGYDQTYGGSFTHVAWTDVFKAIEKPRYFAIYLNGLQAKIVPKRGFHVPSDIPMLRSILCAKLGAKAKVFSQ